MTGAKEAWNPEPMPGGNHEANGRLQLPSTFPTKVQVIISHFAGRRYRNLVLLLDALQELPAGWPYQVRVVVTRDCEHEIRLPTRLKNMDVLYRDDVENDLRAWDFGWRAEPSAGSYLFLEDACRLIRAGWARAFVQKAAQPGVGLVGERIDPRWRAAWELLLSRTCGVVERRNVIDAEPADRLHRYLRLLGQWGIDAGSSAEHLQARVLFARREVLEAMGGFPSGTTEEETAAAEIGISKKVQALGLKTLEVGPEPVWCFQHPAWKGLYAERPRRSSPFPANPRPVLPRKTIQSTSRCTILTPTYNKPSFLAAAARSVKAQTHTRWEWWLVLDGPDPETLEVAEDLSRWDPRIHVFHESTSQQERQTVYRPAVIFNEYFPRVETPYMCWLSDDDLLEPYYLESLIGAIESNRGVEVAYGACEVLTQTVANQWRHVRWLVAEQPIGVGTARMPDRIIDGGQIVQTKQSYDALQGYRQPTDWRSASHVDGIYMNELARQFTFFPVFEKVMAKRCTYLSTHVKGEGGPVQSEPIAG